MIIIGKIVGCFGIRGFLKIQPATHSIGRFSGIISCYVGNPEGKAAAVTVEEVKIRESDVLVRFSGSPDRNSAEKLVGEYLMVRDEDAAPPPPGTRFIHEIIGCEVLDSGGMRIGTVTEVYKLPAQDVWAIRTSHGSVLFPAVEEFIELVDIGKRKIVIRPPDGLLSEEE